MPDETIKYFLEQIIESIEGINAALSFVLQYYTVTTAEKEFLKDSSNLYKCCQELYKEEIYVKEK